MNRKFFKVLNSFDKFRSDLAELFDYIDKSIEEPQPNNAAASDRVNEPDWSKIVFRAFPLTGGKSEYLNRQYATPGKGNTPTDYMIQRDAAKKIGITPAELAKMRQQGKAEGYRLGRCVYYHRTEVIRLIKLRLDQLQKEVNR